MKSVQINQWAQPAQVEEIPQPTPSDNEVLVKVRAASLNPIDTAIAAGYLRQMLTLPMSSGSDFAGDVVSVGAGVTHVKPGDVVYGLIALRGGTFAEYAVVKANEVAQKPASLNYVQASAVPLVALTAWQSLFDVAKLQKGERLLILGAGGAVGNNAIQFAKEMGAYVIGVAGPEKERFVRDLGVDEYINYQTQQFEEIVTDIDVVLDAVGGENMQRAFGVVKPGGRLVTIVGQPSQEEAASRGIQAFGAFAQSNSEQLKLIAELIDAGKLKVFVQKEFPLEEIQSAFEFFQTVKTPGKVVIKID